MAWRQRAIAVSVIGLAGLMIGVGWQSHLVSGIVPSALWANTSSTRISPSAAQALIAANRERSDFVILDVRTPAEFADGHIAGAINLDFHDDTFAQQLAQLDRDATYLVYCQRGVRSDRTLAMMQALGFEHVYDLAGGISHWRRDGFAVVSP